MPNTERAQALSGSPKALSADDGRELVGAETFAQWQWRFAHALGRNPTAQDAFEAFVPRAVALRLAEPAPQWLWRVFNLGFPRGHEDGSSEWEAWQVISHADALRLAGDDENGAYQFVPFAPAIPTSKQVADVSGANA